MVGVGEVVVVVVEGEEGRMLSLSTTKKPSRSNCDRVGEERGRRSGGREGEGEREGMGIEKGMGREKGMGDGKRGRSRGGRGKERRERGKEGGKEERRKGVRE